MEEQTALRDNAGMMHLPLSPPTGLLISCVRLLSFLLKINQMISEGKVISEEKGKWDKMKHEV